MTDVHGVHWIAILQTLGYRRLSHVELWVSIEKCEVKHHTFVLNTRVLMQTKALYAFIISGWYIDSNFCALNLSFLRKVTSGSSVYRTSIDDRHGYMPSSGSLMCNVRNYGKIWWQYNLSRPVLSCQIHSVFFHTYTHTSLIIVFSYRIVKEVVFGLPTGLKTWSVTNSNNNNSNNNLDRHAALMCLLTWENREIHLAVWKFIIVLSRSIL